MSSPATDRNPIDRSATDRSAVDPSVFDLGNGALHGSDLHRDDPAAADQGAAVPALLQHLYGPHCRIAAMQRGSSDLVLSREREIDLIELEQLCDAVGWSRRPMRRVRKALAHSLLLVGLWRHDRHLPRLVGFARCTGDGVVEATVWDVAVHPHYQGAGLGKQLMAYVLDQLRGMEVERVTLFADPQVVGFYQAQGWELEPLQRRCAFWYAP
jgi:GNAT superfamily N-acetyltransferase